MAFALRDSNSAWLMAPESSSALASAIWLAGVVDLPATCWMYSCWAACCCGHCLHLPLGHAAAPGDQVDERAEPGNEDQQYRPAGLAPTAERVVSEQVEQAAEPHHQGGDPDEEPETPQQNVPEVSRSSPSLLLQLVPAGARPVASRMNRSGPAEHLPGPIQALKATCPDGRNNASFVKDEVTLHPSGGTGRPAARGPPRRSARGRGTGRNARPRHRLSPRR